MTARAIYQRLYDINGKPCGSRQYRCIYCGGAAQCFDHVIPKKKGGADSEDNLVPACTACNTAKSDRTLDYFLRDFPLVLRRVRLTLAGEHHNYMIDTEATCGVPGMFYVRIGEEPSARFCAPPNRHRHHIYHWVESSRGSVEIFRWDDENGPDGTWCIHGNNKQFTPCWLHALGYSYLRPVQDERLLLLTSDMYAKKDEIGTQSRPFDMLTSGKGDERIPG